MPTGKLPAAAAGIAERYPDLWKSYAGLGKSCAQAGPLDARARRLVKLGLAIGTGSEGAVHSHARRALEEGFTMDELRHAALLAITTIGFPHAIAALSWIEDLAGSAQTVLSRASKRGQRR
jgi:alkylhydroperoxidase/carboxymuconolactone decarboxylase family protein YurZ